MEKIKITIGIIVALLVFAYNIRLYIRKKNKDNSQTYYVTAVLKPGVERLVETRGGEKRLTAAGEIVEDVLVRMHEASHKVSVKGWAIMADHALLLLTISNERDELLEPIKFNIRSVIQVFFKAVDKRIGHGIWQSQFQSGVVKNEDDLRKAAKEIAGSDGIVKAPEPQRPA